ncbi:RNA-directed DNA polymerase from mobile element jockey [Trichonephila clavipes]|nr:RNA-directed DNA polymerase from mobile element jockey [Trichonephila clavipes]
MERKLVFLFMLCLCLPYIYGDNTDETSNATTTVPLKNKDGEIDIAVYRARLTNQTKSFEKGLKTVIKGAVKNFLPKIMQYNDDSISSKCSGAMMKYISGLTSVKVWAIKRRRAGHSFPVEDFKKTFNSGSNCIIAGDYNAAHVSWHNAKSTRFGQALHKLIRDLRGAKLVAPQTATHLQSRQRFGSVIDLAVFKHIPFNHSVRVINDLSSDHYPVILEINLNTSIIKNPEHLSTNWYNFKFALNKKPLPTVELTSNDNIELAISELNQNFTEAFVEASKPKFNNAPKILSPEIKFKIYQRNRLRKFWQRTRCPSIYSQFRTLSREIAKDIQAYSRVQWEKHIEALSPVDNTLWRKSSLLRKPFQSIPLERGSWHIAITPIEKAEVIADSLQVQFEPNHVAGRELFDQRIHDEVTNFINTPHVQEIEPTTPTEVLSYVQRLKPRKSPDLIRFLIV